MFCKETEHDGSIKINTRGYTRVCALYCAPDGYNSGNVYAIILIAFPRSRINYSMAVLDKGKTNLKFVCIGYEFDYR
jgi:hypothetical protein